MRATTFSPRVSGVQISWKAFKCCSRLKKVLTYIYEHPDETLSLRNAANIAAMERTYFSDYFRVNVGVSFKYWIDFVRIQRAEIYLRTSDKSVMTVALDCGFGDATTFTRTFHRIVGITPLRYRQGCKRVFREPMATPSERYFQTIAENFQTNAENFQRNAETPGLSGGYAPARN